MQKIFPALTNVWNGNHGMFQYFLVIILSYSLFFWLQASPTLADPDSFYHAKIAEILSQGKILHEFPWLQYTTLNDRFVDHHFLYHMFLVPFVSLFPDPLAGLKFSVVAVGTAVFTLLFWFLKSNRVPLAFILTMVLLLAGPYLFRANLAKAPILSLAVLILGLYFLFQRKPLPLFFLSFSYVWMYAGWPLLAGAALLFVFTTAVVEWIKAGVKNLGSWLKDFWICVVGQWKLIAAVFGGLAAGVVINPYFPDNLWFTWQQAVKIGLVNYQNIIGVGGEWYPYPLPDLIGGLHFVFIPLIIAFILFVSTFPKQSSQSMTLFVLMLLFFLLTLKSKRNIEYFAPFAILFSGFALRDAFTAWKLSLKEAVQNIRPRIPNQLTLLLVIAYLLMMIPFSIMVGIQNTKRDLSNGSSFTLYQNVSSWLSTHSPKGSIVLHSDWDESPVLFYHNDWNYYIVGLDPTFMYEYDKDLYWKWVNITTGKGVDDLEDAVKKDLNAQYVFVASDHEAMDKLFVDNKRFEKIYEDQEGKIYHVL